MHDVWGAIDSEVGPWRERERERESKQAHIPLDPALNHQEKVIRKSTYYANNII